MRTTLLAIAALAAVAVSITACGEAERSADGEKPTADAGNESRLGEARFDALEAAVAAGVPLDKFSGKTLDLATFRDVAKPLVNACEALDPGDALLGQIRRLCSATVTFNEQLVALGEACQDASTCSTAVNGVRTTLAGTKRVRLAADRTIAAADITSSCKEALRTPQRVYTQIDDLDSALALLQHGLETGSQADIEEAQRRLQLASNANVPNYKESLEKFRSGCA